MIMNEGWMRFNKYLYKYRRLEALVILLGLATVPLTLINPYLTKLVIDKAYGNKDIRLFFILAIIGGSIFVFNVLIDSLNGYLSQCLSRRVHFDMTKDLFRHLESLPLSFFNNKSTGDHIYSVSSDVGSVSSFVSSAVPYAIMLFPRLLFILVIVFYLNWKLALFAILMVPISYIHPYFFGKWLQEITRRIMERSQRVFRELHEAFSHIHLVKIFGREDYEIKKFEEELSERMDFESKAARLSSISDFSGSVLNKVIGGIIALYGGYQLISGAMSLGSLTAIMIYVTQLMGLVNSAGEFYKNIAVNSVSRRRLAEILDINPEIKNSESAVNYNILHGKIGFNGVWFGYEKDKFIAKDISLSIGPASKIALVGPSGCGKTTLLNLILRLYEPENGSIFIDGLNIKDIKLESLKKQIGMVLQEPFLWDDTVANNILYGAEAADEEEIINAARVAEAHAFIMNLPKQYDSIVGEMACKISEGQKQRIAIARAVIKNPKILILDEAMSSLDSETEDKILDNIRREFSGSTLIAVSHRLSTVKKMDLVYFFEGASKIDSGTHDVLMERNRKYHELFASQIETERLNTEKVY